MILKIIGEETKAYLVGPFTGRQVDCPVLYPHNFNTGRTSSNPLIKGSCILAFKKQIENLKILATDQLLLKNR